METENNNYDPAPPNSDPPADDVDNDIISNAATISCNSAIIAPKINAKQEANTDITAAVSNATNAATFATTSLDEKNDDGDGATTNIHNLKETNGERKGGLVLSIETNNRIVNKEEQALLSKVAKNEAARSEAEQKTIMAAASAPSTPLCGKDVSFDVLPVVGPHTQNKKGEEALSSTAAMEGVVVEAIISERQNQQTGEKEVTSLKPNEAAVKVVIDVRAPSDAIEPVRKSRRAKIPSFKLADAKLVDDVVVESKPTTTASSVPPTKKPSATTTAITNAQYQGQRNEKPFNPKIIPSPPKTPQELHDRITKSRDKLFFIAYSHSQDPLINTAADETATTSNNNNNNKNKDANNNGTTKYQWYLVRVDLATCGELEDTENCEETGKYYVDFYTKASYDQGILLAGNPLENGIPAAKMKPRPDSVSRYWLEWHEYYFDKDGGMVVENAKEFLPNSKKAMKGRLMELSQRIIDGTHDDDSVDERERRMSEYHPDFDRFTSWADVLNLMDTKTRLVGPFDFDDIKSPPLKEEDLEPYDDELKKLFIANHANLLVKDRVNLSYWQELSGALRGRDIEPPTIAVEKHRKRSSSKKRLSGAKRAREEVNKGQQQVERPSCRDCGNGGSEDDPLLHFAAASSQSAFYIRESCVRKNDNASIAPGDEMKEKILSLVEAAFDGTRRATSSVDGRNYYVLDELKDSLNEKLGSRMDDALQLHRDDTSSFAAAVSSLSPVSEILEGVAEANFDEEDVESSFPVAFAYHAEDPSGISEENAKIATLDYEVEQRRQRRRQSEEAVKHRRSEEATKKGKSSVKHPTLDHADVLIAPIPAEEFPEGWMKRKVPRPNRTTFDTRFYSPKKSFRFRNRKDVRRFLETLKKSGGDEQLAIERYYR